LLSSTNWTTFNNKQNAISLTTTGTSGAATFVSNTLNIPNYSVSFTNNVNDYIMTGTGTTNTLNGEAALRWDGTTLRLGPESDNDTNYSITTRNQMIIHANDNAANNNFFTQLIMRSGAGTNLSTIVVVGSGSANYINFATSNTDRVRVHSTGNVTIGTTTDAGFKLDVVGTIRSSGVITASGGTSTDWNTAFGWGDHAAAGYITGTTGYTGFFTVPTNPPGMQTLDIQNGLIVNVM
jgi:hypothetical protein